MVKKAKSSSRALLEKGLKNGVPCDGGSTTAEKGLQKYSKTKKAEDVYEDPRLYMPRKRSY